MSTNTTIPNIPDIVTGYQLSTNQTEGRQGRVDIHSKIQTLDKNRSINTH